MPSYLFDFLIVSDFISSKYEQHINTILFSTGTDGECRNGNDGIQFTLKFLIYSFHLIKLHFFYEQQLILCNLLIKSFKRCFPIIQSTKGLAIS